MRIAHPSVFCLLVIPIGLLLWIWLRPGRHVVLPFDHGKQSSGRGLRILIGLAESTLPLVLIMVICILSGPQQLSDPTEKRKLTNIEFCVDISGSMTARFGDGTRYDASMEAINEFLAFRDGDDYGLTFFGNSVLQWVPLTSDSSAIRCSPPFMRPEVAPPWFGGTQIGKALLSCRKVLTEREEGDRMIILVSDGYSSDLRNDRDAEIARKLKDDSITVYAVHISNTQIPDEIVNITHMTGGEVFNPGDLNGLKGVFHRIDEMQKTELEKTNADWMDNFIPFSIVGLFWLGVSSMGLMGLRYTPW